MGARRTLMAVAAAAAVSVVAPASGQSEQCRDAIEQYNSSVEDIRRALTRYAQCVAQSEREEDCSSEFNQLESAHGEFEQAVTEHQRYCRR
jgi:hypothetical protein